MAYDELTTQRYRDALHAHLGGEAAVEEKKMMGGVCFMLNGNMVGGANREKETSVRRFMFRLGKDNIELGNSLPGAIPVVLGKRKMPGFFHVEEESCDDEALGQWVTAAVSHAQSLPPK